MLHYKLALLGFGNVGQAFSRLLLDKDTDLKNQYNITFSVTGITTGHHGSAVNTTGLDLAQALELIENGNSLNALSSIPVPGDNFEFIHRSDADVLFENTPVNYASGQPAVDHIKTALEMNMHAITANKGPVVHAYRRLTDLASSNGRIFFFESTVMDGAPVFSTFRQSLPAAQLRSFRGILNSTTNLILTRMEAGESFDQALKFAQSIGIAETDPSGDIDGWDAAVKVAALVTVLMDTPIKPAEVDRLGIRGIKSSDITYARSEGKRWKLVCSAKREGDHITTRVAPELVESSSPLFNVDGTTSIIQFETDVLGKLSIIETDPSLHTTAYGLLADFINAVKESEP
jgi:homoserine dehydrogenase